MDTNEVKERGRNPRALVVVKSLRWGKVVQLFINVK